MHPVAAGRTSVEDFRKNDLLGQNLPAIRRNDQLFRDTLAGKIAVLMFVTS